MASEYGLTVGDEPDQTVYTVERVDRQTDRKICRVFTNVEAAKRYARQCATDHYMFKETEITKMNTVGDRVTGYKLTKRWWIVRERPLYEDADGGDDDE